MKVLRLLTDWEPHSLSDDKHLEKRMEKRLLRSRKL